jgi:hypothetical protein
MAQNITSNVSTVKHSNQSNQIASNIDNVRRSNVQDPQS